MRTFVGKIKQQIIAATLLIALIFPNVAYAQLAVTAPILETQAISDYIQRLLKVVFRNVVVVGAVNVSQQIAREAAESIATWVVSGAPGQNPLTYMKSPADYVEDQTRKALGDVLDQMSEDFANASLLCINDPAAPLGVLAGLYGALNQQANIPPFNNKGKDISGLSTGTLGKCDAGSIALSYKSLNNELSADQLLDRFNKAFTGGGSEVESIFQSQLQALSAIVREQKQAEYERLATKTHKDLTSPISGEVLQSSSQIQEDASLNSAKFQMEQEAQLLGGVLASGAEAIPAIFATTLANSLSKKLIARFKQGKGSIASSKEVNLGNIFGAGKSASSGGPGSIYSDVKTAVISEGDIDQLSLFNACPDKFAQPDNCVLDSAFVAAIRAADAGKPLTVKDALDQDKLHANWELVSASQTARNEDRLCFKSAYCQSNLSKMRKVRVIPIGWEIAAATADGAGKATLGEVVKGFNNCAYSCSNDATKTCTSDGDCGSGNTCRAGRDKQHPYCHLIDPNWVLRMPELVCRAKVYGAVLENEMAANRQEVCADQASCLQEDDAGKCTGAYGYCLRERNTFRFDAESCPAQFAGCRLFNNKQFGQIGLIESTLSTAVCSEKNTGCLGYSVDYKSTGGFDATKPKAYLNAKAEQCDAKYAGCTEVQNGSNGKTQFLRLAPPSLGCKGLLSDPSECAQYAQSCTVDEVGCELYQPVGSAEAAIPGIATLATKDGSGAVIAWNDECAAECVGYTSYYQSPTQTEPLAAPATAFIPKTAKQCTQDVVGCDAYTNIDSATKGGGTSAYFSKIQKCTDPSVATNHAVFYSWEGSDQSGYQLRQHDLTLFTEKKSVFGAGSPLYDAADAELGALDTQCNATVYKNRVIDGKPNPKFNADCRELFDAQGLAYYRLVSKTVVSSASCALYRREKSDQKNCEASRGTFIADTGACEYGILASGASVCKQEFVGCRAYNGAASLSPKIVVNETFASASGWSGGELSSEGITVGDSVLKISGATASRAISVSQGKTYHIVLWAKGNGSVNVKFKSAANLGNDALLNSQPLVVTPDWRRFEVSSSVAPWTDAAAQLVFEKTAGTSLVYLENLVIKEQTDVVYAIKNSWVTPAMCDANPTDSIPGAGLNCRAYKPKSDSKKPTIYLTGFTGLCNASAAGCQKFLTTQNTNKASERTVEFGSVSRVIPADDLVYAVANSAAFCPADKKGCSALGLTVDGKSETVHRMNNPENYATTACKQEEEWCQTFNTSDGVQRYFKYPDAKHRCEYHEKKEVKGVEYSGWFIEGTIEPCYAGFVSGGNTYGVYKNGDANYGGMTARCDQTFDQCTEFVDRADVSKDDPAGRSYFFMKNSRLDTATCNGKVSLKEGCTILDDVSNGDKNISTLSTYCKSDPTTDVACAQVLKNANVAAGDQAKDGVLVGPVGTGGLGALDKAAVDCDVAQTNGLFVATDCQSQLAKLKNFGLVVGSDRWLPNPDYDPALPLSGTVPLSALNCNDASGVAKVAKIVAYGRGFCVAAPDANTVVKVRRDRTCAEWLACQSSVKVFDKISQKNKEVCTQLGVCNKLSTDSGAVGQCGNWVTPQQLSPADQLSRALPLTTERYVSRNVGWYGLEFSGYSLWHKFQPDTVGWFSKSQAQAESGNMLMGVGFEPEDATCAKNTGANNGKSCIAKMFTSSAVQTSIKNEFGNVSFNGVCYAQQCWYPIEGFMQQKAAVEPIFFTESSCRGYPEQDSPFPVSVIAASNIFGVPSALQQGYQHARVCEQNRFVAPKWNTQPSQWTTFDEYQKATGQSAPFTIKNASCDCSYKKIEYGKLGVPRYFSLDDAVVKGKDGEAVLARWKASEPGHIRWYPGKIASQAGGKYDIKYDDGDFESGVAIGYLAYPGGDKSGLKKGDVVVAQENDHGWWYEATVEDPSSASAMVKFPDEIKFNDPKTQQTHLLSVPFAKIAIKATQQTDAGAIAAGTCSGGWFVEGSRTADNPKVHSKIGLSCNNDYECIDERVVKLKSFASKASDDKTLGWQYSNDDGKCEFKTKETKFYGWKGYCLEKDFRTHVNGRNDEQACLTWLPIDIGSTDVYNQYTSAAFKVSAAGEGRYYCAATRGRAKSASSGVMSYKYQSSVEYVVTGEKDVNSYTGYKDYGMSGLPNNLKSREIDYVELVATDKNTFFPAGFVIKIVDDGKVRVYAKQKWYDEVKEKNPSYKCPVGNHVTQYKKNAWGYEGPYDFFDPTHHAFSEAGVAPLTELSRQVLCGESAGGAKNPCSPFDSTDSTKDPNDFFTCQPGGETKSSAVTPKHPKAIAVTGVARTGKGANGRAYVRQLADVNPNSTFQQIWFVRIDNQAFVNWNDHYSSDGGNGYVWNEFNNAFWLGDIVTTNNGVAPAQNLHGAAQSCSGDTNDSKYGAQQGYTLRLRFGDKGDFYGIDAASCMTQQNGTLQAGWDVRVHLRDACTQILQTDDDGKNVAFTHRLWGGYPQGSVYTKLDEPDTGVTEAAIMVNSATALVPSAQFYGSLQTNQTPNHLVFTHKGASTKTGLYFSEALGGGDGARGYSCATGGANCLTKDNNQLAGSVTLGDGTAALNKLFARFYKLFVTSIDYNPVYKQSPLDEVIKSDNTLSGVAQAPALFALDPSTCTGARGGTCQLTRKYGMTINGVYDAGGIVFGKGSVAANVQFYGSADQNHMPIRRLKIAWGDGSPALIKEGMYRNHKPACSTPAKPAAVCKFDDGNGFKIADYNHTCTTDKDCVGVNGTVAGAVCSAASDDLKWAFGTWAGDGASDDGACEPAFFQYVHAYTFTPTCSVSGGSAGANSGKLEVATPASISQYSLAGKVGIGERFCVFKPRVQLKDNWDVCNGETQGYGGKDLEGNLLCEKTDVKYFTPFQGYIIVKE